MILRSASSRDRRAAPRPTAPLLAGRAELIDDGVHGNRPFVPGAVDLASRIEALAERLTDSLKPLAAVAYNYRWSWAADGAAVFRDINPHRWTLAGGNPVRFLSDLWPLTQEAVERNDVAAGADRRARRPRRRRHRAAAADALRRQRAGRVLLRRVRVPRLDADLLGRPRRPRGRHPQGGERPGAADDRHRPLLPARLLPAAARRRGAPAGVLARERPEEPADGPRLRARRIAAASRRSRSPASRSPSRSGGSTSAGCRCCSSTPSCRRTTPSRAGRRAGSTRATAPCGSPSTALLGIGGARVLDALGIEPAVIHLNEGHPALAPLELATQRVERGASDRGRAAVRARADGLHDPHAGARRATRRTRPPSSWTRSATSPTGSGSTTRSSSASAASNPGQPRRAARDDAARDQDEPSPQRRQPAPRRGRPRDVAADVPGLRSRQRPDHARHERRRTSRPSSATRCASCSTAGSATRGSSGPATPRSGRRCATSRTRSCGRRAARPGPSSSATFASAARWTGCSAASRSTTCARSRPGSTSDALTIGFARRFATYKRVYLLTHDPDRALPHPLGRPARAAARRRARRIPNDEAARTCSSASTASSATDAAIADRVVIIEDYDLDVGAHLVSGCDVWINLPRRPMEASGTSGMKATFNGGAPAERARRLVGRGLRRRERLGDPRRRGRRPERRRRPRCRAVLRPARARGDPALLRPRRAAACRTRWCERIKHALVTCAPAFSATRMVNEYVEKIYRRAAERLRARGARSALGLARVLVSRLCAGARRR